MIKYCLKSLMQSEIPTKSECKNLKFLVFMFFPGGKILKNSPTITKKGPRKAFIPHVLLLVFWIIHYYLLLLI